jgi:hypothetical protein
MRDGRREVARERETGDGRRETGEEMVWGASF